MKKIKILTLFLFVIAGLTSCVEEAPIFNPEDSPNVIEIKNIGAKTSPSSKDAAVFPVFTNALEIVPEIDFPVTISYSGANVAPEDITVTLGVNASAIDTYNKWWNKDDDPENLHEDEDQYEVMPSTLYSFPSTTVTIPKGKRETTFIIKVRTDQFDLNKNYGLPLTITKASQGIVSGNFGTAILAIKAKNKYDGNYSVTATSPMIDRTSAALTGFYPLDADLITTGANSVVMFTYTYLGGLEGHPIKSNGSSSYYGNFAPIFTMDSDGNVVSVTNFYGQGTNASTRAARLDPSGVNKFTISADGQTKTLEVSYVMIQGGVDRTFFHEKWTFEGDR